MRRNRCGIDQAGFPAGVKLLVQAKYLAMQSLAELVAIAGCRHGITEREGCANRLLGQQIENVGKQCHIAPPVDFPLDGAIIQFVADATGRDLRTGITERMSAPMEVYPQWRLAAKCCGTRFDTASKRLLVSTCSDAKFPPRKRPRRLARPRTSPFHGGNTGSNPVGDAKSFQRLAAANVLVHQCDRATLRYRSIPQ